VLDLADLEGLPGAEIVIRGISDLRENRTTIESLLVSIGAPRLTWLGIELPEARPLTPEMKLYEKLADECGNDAHSQYNAWLRRLISLERALEHRVFAEQRRRASDPAKSQRDPRAQG